LQREKEKEKERTNLMRDLLRRPTRKKRGNGDLLGLRGEQ